MKQLPLIAAISLSLLVLKDIIGLFHSGYMDGVGILLFLLEFSAKCVAVLYFILLYIKQKKTPE